MKPDRWQKVDEILQAALQHSSDRKAFIDEACRGDEDLQREVESLLAQQSEANQFMEEPAMAVLAKELADEQKDDQKEALIGRRIGPYKILSLLGAGGMGEVYRASDSQLKRQVAVKVLPRRFADDRDRMARFQREAHLLASLNHPNIASIYGLQESNGVRALVMELVEGPTLADRLRPGPVPVTEALSIARQITDALDAAHERGIVHRDLKPANIKVREDGMVKVLDFGLAKATIGKDLGLDPSQAPTRSYAGTREGLLLGTAAYMSPEQARGRAVDKRTDIWAFACVLYEMLTGRVAFGRETISDTLAAVLEREVDWDVLPPALPASVRRTLRRCLEKDPKRRLHDIADARIEIDDLVAAEAIDIVPPQAAKRATSFRWLWAVSCVTGVALLALTLLVATGRVGFIQSDQAPTFSRIVRFTSSPAREWAPAISADGKWVAYLSNARGPTDVWVKFVAGGEAANLSASTGLEITPGTGIAGMDISPDGTRIAVMARMLGSTSPFETWAIQAPLSGPPTKLLEGFLGLRWSMDGRRITFVRAGGSAGDALWVANADGTDRREIIKLSRGVHIHWPTWSRNGQIYFIDTRAPLVNMEPSGISRIDPDSGKVERVITTARRAIFPLPMPDGSGLIFAANPDATDLSLWWRPTHGGKSRRLTFGIGEYAEPRVSADGRTLVCTLYDVRQSLIRVALAQNFGTTTAITGGFTGDLDPSLLPSDSRLVFSSSRAGNRNLWTSALDGSGARPLTSGAWLDERPSVSPDGREIVFVSDRGGRRELWLMSPDGGEPRQLADVNVIGGMAWSRDGREITFAAAASADGPPALWVLTVADGRMRRVAIPDPMIAVGDSAPDPTSDVIAYIAATTSGRSFSRLEFVDFDGHPARTTFPPPPNEIAIGGGFGNGILAWAPDGKRLAAVSQGTNTPSIWIVEPDVTNPYRKLIEFSGGPRIRGITWTRDGSAIIIGKHDIANSDIVIMDTAPDTRNSR